MDKVLKQRLVGASILIALAVIFLPMLFDDDDHEGVEQRELALDLPQRAEGERRVRRLALDPAEVRQPPEESRAESPPDAPAGSTDAPPAEPEVGVRPEAESEPEPRPQVVVPELAEEGQQGSDEESDAASEPATEDEAGPEVAATPSVDAGGQAIESEAGGRWTVQVAVFGNRETAASVRERLQGLGHRVGTDVIVRDQSELFRLRTGPYGTRAEAERALGQIRATVAGVDPAVRELGGDGGDEDRSGLSVQVGSFASRNNAERLVNQLETAGFDAFMHAEDSGGRTIWRVRVGTYAERADAEQLLETLREQQGLEGIVVSHP